MGTLPAYDLQKVDDSNFLLCVSVPGWKDDELEIETVGESAYFRETPETDASTDSGERWIYKGIRRANFQLSFSLPEHAQINQAQLDSGILKIAIHQKSRRAKNRVKLRSRIRGA